MSVILTMDKVHTTLQKALDSRSGLGGLKQVHVMGLTIPHTMVRVYVAYILISLPDVLFGIILISYRQMLTMLEKSNQTCHTSVQMSAKMSCH